MSVTPTTGKIYQSICAVMSELGAIGKVKDNKQQGFKYRGIDDMYNELHDILAKHKVFTVPTVLDQKRETKQSRAGSDLNYSILTIQFRFYAEDGSSVEAVVIGEGMDSGDKASNKAMSVAHKYALIQVFAIATEDLAEPDAESHETVSKTQEKKTVIPNVPGNANQSPVGAPQTQKSEAPKANPANNNLPPSEAQLTKYLPGVLQRGVWSAAQCNDYVQRAFNKPSPREITRVQFQELCKIIERYPFQDAIKEFETFDQGDAVMGGSDRYGSLG